jgi:hypothetical protein
MLGIYFGPTSGGGTHMRKMAKKGYTWADRIRSRSLSPDLAWKSFTHQLQPGMMWGIATVVMSPHRFLKQFQQVYFRCLPLLNVNCHIELSWRLIPEQYQGLGMANYALVPLASKLSYLQCKGGFEAPHSNALMTGYESFTVEVGLYSNTIEYEYKTHSILATDNTWFKNVWELVSYLNVRLQFNTDFHLKPIRQGDTSLMSEFICIWGFSPTDLVSLNVMRMHEKVIHKSDIVLCDGKTIKAEMLTDLPGHSDSHKFPTQCPTPADLVIWKTALLKLSSNFIVLMVKLQEYISPPHLLPLWLLNDLGTTLHHNIVWGDKLYHKVYSPSLNTLACRTRSGQRFDSTIIAYGPSNFQRCASVTLSQEGQVFLHSSIPGFVPVQPTSSFENVIKGFANQSLCASLEYNWDSSWILDGMLAQSLVIIHDESYMRDLSPASPMQQL